MRGAGRGGRPPIAIPPSADLVGEPADIGAYLQYARENMDRSRMLLQRDDLRYALFSANEGLELCVKAYLLHYKIITDPVVAGHFPYAAIIDSLRKSTEQFGDHNPDSAGLVRQTEATLDKFEALFKKLRNRRARISLWKESLGIKLGTGEQKLLDGLGLSAPEWSTAGLQTPAGSQQEELGSGPEEIASIMPEELRAPLLALFYRKFPRPDSRPTVTLLGGREMPAGKALYVGRLVALVELFLYTTIIVSSSAHQQISRYPTQIDGFDSAEVYVRHRDGVERLLNKIYGACDMLLRRLDGQPPAPPGPRAASGARPKPAPAPRPARHAWGGASAAVGSRERSGRRKAAAGNRQRPPRAPDAHAAPPSGPRPCRRAPAAGPPGQATRVIAQRGQQT